MGISKKLPVDDEPEGKKWVIAGIPFRTPLKPINTRPKEKDFQDDEKSPATTPTARESKIPEKLPCPPPPRKRRPKSTCHAGAAREFFTPPDLETVFVRRVERAN